MGFEARIVLDSIAHGTGIRLTTVEMVAPRFILAEQNTHRTESRNTSSSRAMPVKKIIEKIMDDPFIPEYWGTAKVGMQAGEPLTGSDAARATAIWMEMLHHVMQGVQELAKLKVHKQIANRPLETWMWCKRIVTATEWENFFKLRTTPEGFTWPAGDAQPEMQKIANLIKEAYDASVPVERIHHIPYTSDTDMKEAYRAIGNGYTWDWDYLEKLSVARCARVSYWVDGMRDAEGDLRVYDKLVNADPIHPSPFEHVATAQETPKWSGNFFGWDQLRKGLPNETGSKQHEERMQWV